MNYCSIYLSSIKQEEQKKTYTLIFDIGYKLVILDISFESIYATADGIFSASKPIIK